MIRCASQEVLLYCGGKAASMSSGSLATARLLQGRDTDGLQSRTCEARGYPGAWEGGCMRLHKADQLLISSISL